MNDDLVSNTSSLELFSLETRRIILAQSKRADVGHIGSALSIVEILAALYSNVLNISDPADEKRDRFILSKGHASLCLYAILRLKGWISEQELNEYCGDNTLFGVHPDHRVSGIEFSTGSLGQGLSFAVGTALAAKIKGCRYKTYILMSDAELNEGSVWESIMFAGHHELSNLMVIIDDNGQQAFGYTKDVLNQDDLAERLQSFGWLCNTVNGHDDLALTQHLIKAGNNNLKPYALVAKTTFGKGVSYMENQIQWHYWPMSDELYRQAVDGLEACDA